MDLQQKVLMVSKVYVFRVKSTISGYLNTGHLTQNTSLPNPLLCSSSRVVVSLMMACPKHVIVLIRGLSFISERVLGWLLFETEYQRHTAAMNQLKPNAL
jgi:hypothetical protein